jgi:Cu-processing system permease protein
MFALLNVFNAAFLAILRDRVLHAVFGIALLMLLLVPAFSLFSMRQVQELSITLSLSAASLVLLVFSVLLGSSALWREIEKRQTVAVLGLPLSRSTYLLGKFSAVAFFLLICTVFLGLAALVVIPLSAAQYPSQIPPDWGVIASAIAAQGMKFILLAAIAFLFSSFSTSLFLPVFGTLAVYFAGSASQEVMEYASGELGRDLSAPLKGMIQATYYLLPNFSVFDFKVQAVYALPLSLADLGFAAGYFIIYTAMLLVVATWVFARREIS